MTTLVSSSSKESFGSSVPVRVVCATKMTTNLFFSQSLAGVTLAAHRATSPLEIRLFPENKRGLGEIYNLAIDEAINSPAILVFMHDDVAICDYFWCDLVRRELSRFDLLGVVGNRRRVPGQPSWSIVDIAGQMDSLSNLSGAVGQGVRFPPERLDCFGSVGAPCKLMDGLFLVMSSRLMHSTGIRFDPQFKFHFYDMDICRQVEHCGLSMGTIPLSVVHASNGRWDKEWHETYHRYLGKWGS